MNPRYLILVGLFVSSLSGMAEDRFTEQEGRKENLSDAAHAGEAAIGGMAVASMLDMASTKTFEINGPITYDSAQDIVKLAEKDPGVFGKFGQLGSWITIDDKYKHMSPDTVFVGAEPANMLYGVPPHNYAEWGASDLKSEMARLSGMGIIVKKIRVQPMSLGHAAANVTGAASVASLAVALERLAVALNGAGAHEADGNAYCGPVACQKPSLIKRVFSGAAEPAYERDAEIAAEADKAAVPGKASTQAK